MTDNHATPGPWNIDPVTTRCGGPRIDARSDRGYRIGLADLWDVDGFGGSTEANARLIAAAPDLLEAAQAALAELSPCEARDRNAWEACEGLRAAIAKATGEEGHA